MKRRLIVVLLTVILSIVCLTGNLIAAEFEGDLEIITGYHVDDLDWNIAGDISGTTTPNIISELTWRDLESYQLKLGGRGTINRLFYMRGSVNFAWVLSGDVQDSDYNGNDRTQEFSRSMNSADDSTVFDATFALGYPFRLASDRFRFIPLVGFSYSEQNLTMKDGFQTISTSPPPSVGPIAGLDSTYDTKWYGPWIGVDLSFRASDKIILFAGLEYHWADYEAEANWNLRTDLAHPKSFEHAADGTGFLVTAGGDYMISGPLSLGLELNYRDWSTDPGIDRQFNSDGTIAVTRLNEVNWESFAIMLRVTYRFHYFYRR